TRFSRDWSSDVCSSDLPELVEDYLEELSRLALGVSLIREVNPRLQARVMSMGELMSTTLGAAFLNSQGLNTRLLDARKILASIEIGRASCRETETVMRA